MIVVSRARPEHRALVLYFHRSLYQSYRRELLAKRTRQGDMQGNSDDAEKLWKLSAYRDFEAVLEEDVASLFARPNAQIFLAWKAEEPCGYITGHVELDRRRLLSRRGILEDWFVEQQFRGMGAGKALFENLEAGFKEAGCEVIETTTWPDNQATRSLYQSLGFAEVEVRYRRLSEG